MSLKAKLVSSVAAFCLVLALLVVGILAVPSATVNMGGSISFTATDVVGSIAMKATGNATSDSLAKYTKSASFNADTEEAQATVDWTGLKALVVERPESGDAVVTITLTINNTATDRDMYVKFTSLPALASDAKGVTISETKYGATEAEVLASGTAVKVNTAFPVGEGGTVYVVFTLTVSDFNNTANASWSANVVLSNTNA